jgi:FixJ family two-component response regulator
LTPDSPIVFVVDDDRRVREALFRLISSAGMTVVTFASAAEFLEYEKPDASACLVLDLQIPGMDGLELQPQLAAGDAPPIVFITGHGDIPSTVRAMKAGAVEFLSKPFDDDELLRAIDIAITQDRETRRKRSELSELRQRYDLLTSREREVLPFVVACFANKEAAAGPGNCREHYRRPPWPNHAQNGLPLASGAGSDGGQARRFKRLTPYFQYYMPIAPTTLGSFRVFEREPVGQVPDLSSQVGQVPDLPSWDRFVNMRKT